MSEQEQSKSASEEKVVTHANSGVGLVLTIITFVAYVLVLAKIPGLANEKKLLFGFAAAWIAMGACSLAWAFADGLAKFLAHLLYAVIFALNLGIVLWIFLQVFGNLDSFKEITKVHVIKAIKQLLALFATDLLVALAVLPFARVTRVEPL